MASLSHNVKRNRRLIQFKAPDGTRKKLSTPTTNGRDKRSLGDVRVMVKHSSLTVGLVDRSDDRLVGCCRVLTDFIFRATIYDVMVDQDLQGQGLGKRLLDLLTSHPKLQQVSLIDLACEPALFPFYERCGFKVCDGRAEWMIKVQRAEEEAT